MNNELFSLSEIVILQGLVLSFVVMGVFLSSRVIKFDDLTTEGSFGIGGAITAFLSIHGFSAWITIPLAMIGGAFAGATTGLLHTKFKMNNLISGLVVTTALFSVCLKTASASCLLPENSFSFTEKESSIGILLVVVTIVLWILSKTLSSEIGLILKTLGHNPLMVETLGKDVHGYTVGLLAFSNSLTALSGSFFVFMNGFFSITGNVGTLVIGLSGLILAEMFSFSLWMLVVGSILYQAIFSLIIECELDPLWNTLMKAALIVLLIQCTKLLQRGRSCLD